VRIAWVTPLGVQSAIAEYSINVAEALSKTFDIQILASDPPPWRNTSLPSSPLGAVSTGELTTFDVRIYNMGDHAAFHSRAYEASRRAPGYCVLHDRSYQSLLASVYLHTSAMPQRYVDVMSRHYGEEGRQAATASIRAAHERVWESADESLRFPLDEELLTGALGAVVHSESHRRSLASRWWGPVGRVHFPAYRQREVPTQRRASGERTTLVTIGHLNPNKQIHRVIDAFSKDDLLRTRARYIAAGPENERYVGQLSQLVRERALEGTVEVRPGFMSPDELNRLCAEADVFVNLREPASESASASLLEQLTYGTVIVASDNGCRAELPESAAVKVPEGDDERLTEALRRVVADEELRSTIGLGGWRFAMSQTVELAAVDYVHFLEEAPRWKPALDLADRVGKELATMGVTTASPSLRRISAHIASMGLGR
jgi:glycosyltransferase involved in cell wall biosynthesis